MKSMLAVDPARVLNVYVVAPGHGIAGPPSKGFALLPYEWDYGMARGVFPASTGPQNEGDYRWGVMVDPAYMKALGASDGSPADGTTLVHEVGHYLGLHHVNHGGCPSSPSASACLTSGDFVCDTPQIASQAPLANNTNVCTVQSQFACGGQPAPIFNNLMHVGGTNLCRQSISNGTPFPIPTPPNASGQMYRMAAIGQQLRPSLGQAGELLELANVAKSQYIAGTLTTLVDRRIFRRTWSTPASTDLLVSGTLLLDDAVQFVVRTPRRINVSGTLQANGTDFLAEQPSLGWRGIQFNTGSVGILNGVTIAGVKYAPTGYAVRVWNAQLSMGMGPNQVVSTINGSGGSGGIYAYGSSSNVLLAGNSKLLNHSNGFGLYASNGAKAVVTGIETLIQNNASGGVRADAFGRVTVIDGNVDANLNYGGVSNTGGLLLIRRGWSAPGVPSPSGGAISLSANSGGFRAETGGEVMTCTTSNNFANNGNNQSAPYDVFAFEWSDVNARKSYWGAGPLGIFNEESTVDVTDPLPGPAGVQNQDNCISTLKDGGLQGPLAGFDSVHERISAVARLRMSGGGVEAAELLASGLVDADAGTEMGLLTSAVVRLIMDDSEADATRPLRAWADRSLASGAVNEAWAQRVKLAFAMHEEVSGDVQRFGEALLRSDGEYGVSNHLFAIRALFGLAVQEGQEAVATRWVAEASLLDKDAGEELQRALDLVFNQEGTDAHLFAEPGGTKRDQTVTFLEEGGSSAFALVIAPNPANSEIRVTVPAELRTIGGGREMFLSVYDALGRIAAARTIAGGETVVSIEIGSLPVGVYSIRVSLSDAEGAPAAASSRFTIVR